MSEDRMHQWVEHARFTDIGRVADSLGLGLHLHYGELIGPCPRCGGKDRFVVSLRKQIFSCRQCHAAGDAIALAAHVEGLDVRRREEFLRAVELVNGEPPPNGTVDPQRTAELARRREQAQRARAEQEAEQRAHERRNREWAMHIWHETQPADGTLVASYLRARGITISPPPTLRFHPSLPHRASGTAWPAMVGIVTLDRTILGVHRTWLTRDGSGKASIEEPKMTLGPISGGAVRLGPATEKLMVTEGIENALSVMQAMQALELPEEVREVIICADGDAGGEEAARFAARRWQQQSKLVRIARPPPGMDFNDVLREKEEEGA
jgi:putative DNA primase/helicase